MKKLLIGLTLLASMSSFGEVPFGPNQRLKISIESYDSGNHMGEDLQSKDNRFYLEVRMHRLPCNPVSATDGQIVARTPIVNVPYFEKKITNQTVYIDSTQLNNVAAKVGNKSVCFITNLKEKNLVFDDILDFSGGGPFLWMSLGQMDLTGSNGAEAIVDVRLEKTE